MTEAIIAIAVFIGSLFFAYRRGRKDEVTQHEIDQHNEYLATKKRIEDAVIGGSTDDLRRRMRERDPDQR
jgi:cbb3-type cytochrome oxidase subunit 3